MSRSYKKHPVCTSHATLKPYKKQYNRRFRRRLKRGDFDDYSLSKGNSYRRIENFTWVADNYSFYHTKEGYSNWWMYFDEEEQYQDFMRYYVRK